MLKVTLSVQDSKVFLSIIILLMVLDLIKLKVKNSPVIDRFLYDLFVPIKKDMNTKSVHIL